MKIANNLTFSVRDFRAVHSADINLNGITVVAGINGSGKSTLSKLIYNSVENILHFDGLVRKEVNNEIEAIYRLFERLHERLSDLLPVELLTEEDLLEYDGPSVFFNEIDELGLKVCLGYLEFLSRLLKWEDDKKELRINRFASVLHFIDKEKFTVDYALETLSNRVYQGISSLENFNEEMEKRSVDLFYSNLKRTFNDLHAENISLDELSENIFSKDESSVGELTTLNKAIYLDSPMIVGLNLYDASKVSTYWENFNLLLRREGRQIDGAASVTEMLKDTIKGRSAKDKKKYKASFIYERSDGQRFDLEESATGVRAFSAIQILLNNGVIDEDTLLIIDEPEAHLHPQWIVEYARLIVRMNTQLGVKFFITSHSTDMISALKYINNKEGIKSSLTFYNAEPLQEDPFKFDYRNLERDIEPIFESFNKSFDKIEQYGTDED